MKIFVTGGSGFVGRNLIPILREANYEVLALARSEESADRVEALGARVVRDDLQRLSDNSRKALAECDYVLHSAAYMDFTYDARPYYQINVEATRQLLDLAREAGVRQFVYISAAPVIPGSPVVNRSESDAGKDLPRDLYPRTKAIAERMVLESNAETFRTLSLRPPAIWGPDNPHFEELKERVRKGQWRWIGGGRQVLSTIHVRNLGNAVLAALGSEKGGRAYFVTDGDRRPMRETFSRILRAQGLNPGDKELPRGIAVALAYLFGGMWKLMGLKSRPPVAPLMIRLMATEFSVDDTLARQELGYRNALTFEEGIEELVRRHRKSA